MPPDADVLDPATIAPARRRIQQVQVRATPDEGEGTFEALISNYASTYEIGWGWYERILPGCFAESIALHPTIPVCWNHQWNLGPIGHGDVSELNLGLILRGELYLDLDPLVARLYRAMKAKAVEEWSIAFYVEELTWTDAEPEVDQIVKGDLIEGTACFRGANPDTATLDLRDRLVTIDGDERAVRNEVIRLRSVHGGQGPDPEKFRAETASRREAAAATNEPAPAPAPVPTPAAPADTPPDVVADAAAADRLRAIRTKLVKARDDAETADLALAVDEIIDELADLVDDADAAVGDLLEAVGSGADDTDDANKDAISEEASRTASLTLLSTAHGRELLARQIASASGASRSLPDGPKGPDQQETVSA